MADMTESFETDEYASLLKDFGLRRRSSSLSSSSTDIILHLDEDSDEEIVEDENETFNMVPKDATCSFVKLKKQTSKPEPDEIKAAGEDVHEKEIRKYRKQSEKPVKPSRFSSRLKKLLSTENSFNDNHRPITKYALRHPRIRRQCDFCDKEASSPAKAKKPKSAVRSECLDEDIIQENPVPNELSPHKLFESFSDSGFENIIGLHSHISFLKKYVIYPIMHHSIFNNFGNPKFIKKILFYGPSGVGKTLLAEALVDELCFKQDRRKVTFYKYKVAGLIFRHDDPKRFFEQVFQKAEQMEPSLLIFEDIDKLDLIIQNLLQIFLQALAKLSAKSEVIVVCTTCRVYPDLKIRDQFDKTLEFRLPDTEERLNILNTVMKDENLLAIEDLLPKMLAECTEGFSVQNLIALLSTNRR